jgi:serine/threonine protein kinase
VSTLPTRLGRYNVLGRLAAGGMAEILLATMTGPAERPVVIKRILPHLAEDKAFVEMFRDEANIVAGIRHPRVVQLQELVSDGELFLVLEYVEGESVGGLMRRLWSRGEPLPYWLAAHIVAEACSGLHAAHELTAPDGTPREIVHRDVSPQNVMITYAGDVKVLDFGIAKARDRASNTEAGQVKGKYEYMSPEQCRGKPLDRRSDVFALGILLYELSVGRRLFRRESALTTFTAICDERLPSPRETRPDYPDELEWICRRALARERSDRYRTANDMRRELVAFVRRESGDEVEEDALSKLLHRLFADRIEQKREMLRNVRAGTSPERIPAAEVDPTVEIPSVIGTGLTTDPAPRPASTVGARIAFAVGALGVISALGMLAALRLGQQRESLDPPIAAAAPPSSSVVQVVQKESAPVPSVVYVAIETTPKGASVVVAGKLRGITPLTMEVPRGTDPIAVEISSKGHIKLVQRVVPNADQKLVLHLERTKTVTIAPAKTATSAPVAAPSKSIGRFD